ncbi:MFS transporter [Promethearchaeum syntrophicum]|uniref:MFS transporter n=1 Tax=Promethearchaeum syntrophicum TaxID=2594042 RepID=A0A5B9DDL1_9ARCH|nr:MFS transporter [Candidatus Prometheoarchaeum syntrophicum]QEE17399.1 enterobactin exporter EntS [Candidatus Prometheoarchaeum syntrophicum]
MGEKEGVNLTSNQQTFKHYILFWIGQLFSLFGSSVVTFVLVYWITIEYQSAIILSLAVFFALIPQISVTLFAGVFIDRLDRKKIIIFADLFQAITTLILIIIFYFNLASIWVVISLMILRSFFQAIHQPAVAAIIPVMIPKEKLSRMNAINLLISSAVNTIAPIITGILILFWDFQTLLWIDIGTFLLAIIPAILITIPSVRKEQKTKTNEKISFKKELKEGYHAIMHIKGMLAFFALAVILNFLGSPSHVLRSYFILIFHEGNIQMLSYISAAMQIGMLCGSLLILLRKQWKRKSAMIIIAYFISCIGYLLSSWAPIGNFLLIMVGLFLFAFGIPIVNSLYLTILQETIPLDMQGRVNSVDFALSLSIMPIASLISGPIVEWIGIRYFYVILSTLSLIILTITVIFTDLRYMDKGIVNKENLYNLKEVKEDSIINLTDNHI